MNKTTVGAFFAVPLIVGASVHSTPTDDVHHYNYALTSEALIIDPVNNTEYANLATSLYLDPNGFHGTATTLLVPEVVPAGNLDAAVATGEKILVDAVEKEYLTGTLSASNPLYIFGYSQGAVVASLAEQQLAAYGIPQSDLHFVMAGDSASAHTGFLNTFIDSLPASWRQFTVDLFKQFGAANVLGATTPNNLYETDVYNLSGDGWANWANGANSGGLLTDHLEYLGLTPAEVNSATLVTDGMTDYYTIDSAHVDMLTALFNATQMALSVFFQ
jgi:hypothetical protein